MKSRNSGQEAGRRASVQSIRAGHSILVVDDDPEIRAVLRRLTVQAGYQTELACDGEEALERLRKDRAAPGLILLDLMMPNMTGWDFLKEKERDPSIAAIPVIIMSSSRDPAPLQFASVIGRVIKPFDATDLLGRIERACLDHRV